MTRISLLMLLVLLATGCHRERRPYVLRETTVVLTPIPKQPSGTCPDPAQVYKPKGAVKLPKGCH